MKGNRYFSGSGFLCFSEITYRTWPAFKPYSLASSKRYTPALLGNRWICICYPHTLFLKVTPLPWAVLLFYATHWQLTFVHEKPEEQYWSWVTEEEDRDMLGSWAMTLYIQISLIEKSLSYLAPHPQYLMLSLGEHSSTRNLSFTLGLKSSLNLSHKNLSHLLKGSYFNRTTS